VPLLPDLPTGGSIFCGRRVVNNYVKKEMKETGSTYDLSAALRDGGAGDDSELLAQAEHFHIIRAGKNFILKNLKREREEQERREEERIQREKEELRRREDAERSVRPKNSKGSLSAFAVLFDGR